MHTEYLRVHQRCERHVVEKICEEFPYISVPILPQALVVEAVDLRDLSALMVATKQKNPIPVPNCGINQRCGDRDRVERAVLKRGKFDALEANS
jgi:hypothetical protein